MTTLVLLNKKFDRFFIYLKKKVKKIIVIFYNFLFNALLF